MAEQENLRLARESIEAWSAHDPNRLTKIVDEKFVAESDTLPANIDGPQGLAQFMSVYVTAFPDLHFEIQQQLADGDFVVTRWVATGTHQGVLMGIPPTGRRAVTQGCTVSQFRGGKDVHDWIYWDSGNLLRQLGVLPASN
jgi:steroid delta-isomerase-like uncharacterized protein